MPYIEINGANIYYQEYGEDQSGRVPILLIHGVDDTVVPISQSQRMARALETAQRPYELIELPGEDHWMMTSSASSIRTLTELERFLGKYLAGAPTVATN